VVGDNPRYEAWWWESVMRQCVPQGDYEPDLIRMICRSRGWAPLVNGETCIVHFDGHEYEIKRTK